MTFDEVMVLTRTISSETAFDEAECRAYFDLCNVLPEGSVVVEIGLQFGRSSSIAGQLAEANGLTYIGIDPFNEKNNARTRWKLLMGTVHPSYILFEVESSYAPTELMSDIDLALIDGNHSAEGVRIDCRLLKPLVKPGGHICFHDFEREPLPDVALVAREEMADWTHVGTYGTLGVFRK
tara:strand:- start:1395 stop:1934 length:540 start_codon:yes stop_codon:yes gene_type:complete